MSCICFVPSPALPSPALAFGAIEPQRKLLKVLEDERIRRVGGATERRVDVRIIAATNRDLESRLQEGSFRADLLYRLRVILLALPALRVRGEDIALLAAAFLRRASPKAWNWPQWNAI